MYPADPKFLSSDQIKDIPFVYSSCFPFITHYCTRLPLIAVRSNDKSMTEISSAFKLANPIYMPNLKKLEINLYVTTDLDIEDLLIGITHYEKISIELTIAPWILLILSRSLVQSILGSVKSLFIKHWDSALIRDKNLKRYFREPI